VRAPERPSPLHETQFTSRAIIVDRSKASFDPIVTVCVFESVAITYSGSGAAMPRPLRCPTVK
jgi:hypothetical protein